MTTFRQYAVMAGVLVVLLLLMSVLVNRVHEVSPPEPTSVPTPESSSKDIWDILDSISGLISGVVIAGLGIYLAHVYQERRQAEEKEHREREIRISQAQMVQDFAQYLLSNEERQVGFAIEVIMAVDEKLADALLRRIAWSEASTPGLQKLAREMLTRRIRRIARLAGLSGEELDNFVNDQIRKIINP